jgi:hypothetical protein
MRSLAPDYEIDTYHNCINYNAMRRCSLGLVACGLFLLPNSFVRAQSSIDILDQELKTAKQQHEDMTSQVVSNFFSQVDAGMGSSDAAVSLYQQAGGVLPDPSPVVTQHASETVSERAAREAVDQAAISKLGMLLQLHCGLMHYGALFVLDPKRAGLQEQWVSWLQKAAPLYAQLAPLPEPVVGGNPGGAPHRHKKDLADAGGGGGANGQPPPKPVSLPDLKAKTLHDSIISRYLSFKKWGDGEQGGWAVKDLPRLYRTNVLEPLRVTPNDATLASWDVYIGMMNADEPENDRWAQTVYPPLHFDRACDDYTISPSTEKLEGLIKIVSASPTHPQADDWIARIHKLLDDYRAHHGGSAIAAQLPGAATPTKDPNVTISTEQQGDATIVTTHTNSVANPAPPAPPAH